MNRIKSICCALFMTCMLTEQINAQLSRYLLCAATTILFWEVSKHAVNAYDGTKPDKGRQDFHDSLRLTRHRLCNTSRSWLEQIECNSSLCTNSREQLCTCLQAGELSPEEKMLLQSKKVQEDMQELTTDAAKAGIAIPGLVGTTISSILQNSFDSWFKKK